MSQGLIFDKKVTKFSKTSAAIYLPSRLIGKSFKVIMVPITDLYDLPKRSSRNYPKVETTETIENSEIKQRIGLEGI
jgi:hypothetical protein